MKEFSLKELADIIGAHVRCDTEHELHITGVSIDSRTTRPGDCFFAIAGEKFDGHDYINGAFVKGAVCAVVSRDISHDKPILKVADTVKALGEFAREYRSRAGYKVIAITGSAGKTTTKQIAHHVLSRHFRTHSSPKSFNNNIGLPLTLLGAEHDAQIVIAELGSNHPGEIACLTRIAEPDIAVVTNIHPAHLEGFGDLQAITQEKMSISEGLRLGGALIINGDFDGLVDACRAKGIEFETFGKSGDSDYRVKNIILESSHSRFTIDGRVIYMPLVGPGNVENALAAWTVCSWLGLTIEEFAEAVKTIPPVSMRAELLQIGTITVLNDCYNANPASMKNALDILAGLNRDGERRLIFICGDMAELGHQSEQLHAELGASVARANVGLLSAVGKFAKITAEAARTASESGSSLRKKRSLEIKCFEDAVSACNYLQEFVKDYDIILVKGSRTTGLEVVVERLKELFEKSKELRIHASQQGRCE
jgi:UDP-N-acetylmuramoyl-tripeptide--D-alanyl-D-alanine ligase